MSRLADLYAELFASVFAFRAAGNDTRPGYGSFRAHVMSLLGDVRNAAERDGLDPRQYAHYAAVALVDETVMTSDWPGAEQWRREPLQKHYFDNFLAGEHFFARLDELRQGVDDGLLEVYYYCLCAGFQGRFRDDREELRARRQRVFQQLRVPDLRDEKHITEPAYGRHLERSLARSRFPIWWLAPFVVGAGGLYVAYYVILTQQVSALVGLVP
jgi:type VI secretion system protein ImpK